MTKSDYTHITLVADRSGSMTSIRSDAEGAINTFIGDQAKLPGQCTFTLIQFDNVRETVVDHEPIDQVKPYKLVPRGNTALRDAWGYAIASTGEWLAAMPEDERPANVIIAIVTDGHENSSREYTAEQIKEMTLKQTNEFNWQFLFLAAGQDAVEVGMSYGLTRGQTITYDATDVGTHAVYASMSNNVAAQRATGLRQSFTEEDRKNAAQK